MTFTTPVIDWAALTPLIVVLGAGALGVLLEAFLRTPATRRLVQLVLTTVALVAAAVGVVAQWISTDGAGVEVHAGMVTIDGQSLMWQGIILVFGLLAVALFAARPGGDEDGFTPLGSATPGSAEESLAAKKGMAVTEIYPLLLFAVGGMMLFTAVTDLVVLFVVLEVFSLPLYLMVALARRRRLLSQEAALKYYLLGSFASALYLFGAALVYGATGTTSLGDIAAAVATGATTDPILLAGAVLVLAGVVFKIGAAPFHTWTPDVYQGAPTPVTAFMSAATKAAATAALLRIMYIAFAGLGWELSWFIWIVAIASIAVGSVLALSQATVKRMLAYSSIAHAGFIMVAFAGGSEQALAALPFYLLAYGVASIGAFGIAFLVRETDEAGNVGGEAVNLSEWAGLGKRHPWIAGAMALFLLSFAGIPLTAGFIGKFQAFGAAIDGGAWPLAVVAVLGSAVAAYFYVRLIVLMFFTDADEESRVEVAASPAGYAVIAIAALLTAVLGIVPGPVLELMETAGTVLTSTIQ